MKNSSYLFIILQRMRKPFLVIILTYTIAMIGLLVIDGADNNGNPYNMTVFDAFYFITYTATTIGFGELPYAFTYPQRLWVSFSVYLTVLGWFYGIGTLVALLQDKLFLNEIKKATFLYQVKAIKERFIIVLGYNQITHEIITKALEQGIRAVVIEKDEQRANHLILENLTPPVPVLVTDAHAAKSLEEAGIKKDNCKGVVSIFEDDNLNLRIALTSKLLNPYVKLAVKSTTTNHSENLKDLDVEIIANPFSIISNEVRMALNAPNLLKLQKWIYNIDDLNATLPSFPKGKYIICGYGRMGQHIYKILKNNNIKAEFIEISRQKIGKFQKDELLNITYGNADDKELLNSVGIQEACAIISATNDDTINLSILATARKLNPQIMTIARENEMEDFSIFKNAQIDHIFMPSRILINKTTNALINPLSDQFATLIENKDEKWASSLVRRLHQVIDEKPLLFELKINKNQANEILDALDEEKNVKIDVLCKSLRNQKQYNNVIPLLLYRRGEEILLPSKDEELKENDQILFACDENAKEDIQYIAQNVYEFHYALTGEEKTTIFKGKSK